MQRVLIAKNAAGSVEHFGHFFFAVLVPLLERIRSGMLEGCSVLRSCGPLDRHLRLLEDHGLARFQLLEKERFAALLERCPSQLVEALHSQECYDAHGLRPDGYQPEVLRSVRELAIAHFAPDAPERDLLLVRRGEPEAFYTSSSAEICGGGSERRSIPNLDEIAEALAGSGREVTSLELETAGLVDQIRAFSGARVVVAQHGAALCNALWMSPGSRLVEILPRRQPLRECFSRLAAVVRATYVVVDQDDDHAPVDPRAVVEAVHL